MSPDDRDDLTPPTPLSGAERGEQDSRLPLSGAERDVGAADVRAAQRPGGEVMSRVAARRSIEALRAGVPNQDAVLALGSGQPRIEARFQELLERAADDIVKNTQT